MRDAVTISKTAAGVRACGVATPARRLMAAHACAHVFCDRRRTVQTVLGVIWLLDGGLQLQPFMYGRGFIRMLTGMAAGQPGWLHDSVLWSAHTLETDQTLWNTLFALTQVAIGLGLLYRRTVKPALALSFSWALIVWWFGEAFGMLFVTSASPLTGAPGAVSLYALAGAIAWPSDRPGGLLGARGARVAWATLWALMAWLWLEAPSSSANAISGAIKTAPSGMSWLSAVENWAGTATRGDVLPIALVLAGLSLTIGLAVAADWHPKPFLAVAVALNLAYWIVGQGLGGIFQGSATDPNAGPLFVLLAYALYTLLPFSTRTDTTPRRQAAHLAGSHSTLPIAAAGGQPQLDPVALDFRYASQGYTRAAPKSGQRPGERQEAGDTGEADQQSGRSRGTRPRSDWRLAAALRFDAGATCRFGCATEIGDGRYRRPTAWQTGPTRSIPVPKRQGS